MSRPPQRRRARSEPIRSPFTQRREERASYLTPSDAGAGSRAATRQLAVAVGILSSSDRSTSPPATPTANSSTAMIADARALANPVERRSTLEVLLLRYAELDVDGALGQALENDRETAAHLLAALDRGRARADLGAREAGDESCRALRVSRRSRRRVGRAGSRACIRPGRRSASRVATHGAAAVGHRGHCRSRSAPCDPARGEPGADRVGCADRADRDAVVAPAIRAKRRAGSKACRARIRHVTPIAWRTPTSRRSRAKRSHGRCAWPARRSAISGLRCSARWRSTIRTRRCRLRRRRRVPHSARRPWARCWPRSRRRIRRWR